MKWAPGYPGKIAYDAAYGAINIDTGLLQLVGSMGNYELPGGVCGMKAFVLAILADEETVSKVKQLVERYKFALKSKNKEGLQKVLHKKFKLFTCDGKTEFLDREQFWDLIDNFPRPVLATHEIEVKEAKEYKDNIVKSRSEANGIKIDFEIKIDEGKWYLYKERDQNCASQGIPTTAIINYSHMLNHMARDVLSALVNAISQRSIPKIAQFVQSPYTLYYCDTQKNYQTKTWPLDGFDFPLPNTHPDPNHQRSKVTIVGTKMMANDSIAFVARGSGFNNYFVADRDDGVNIYNYKIRFDMNLTCGSDNPTINAKYIQYAVFNDWDVKP